MKKLWLAMLMAGCTDNVTELIPQISDGHYEVSYGTLESCCTKRDAKQACTPEVISVAPGSWHLDIGSTNQNRLVYEQGCQFIGDGHDGMIEVHDQSCVVGPGVLATVLDMKLELVDHDYEDRLTYTRVKVIDRDASEYLCTTTARYELVQTGSRR